MNRTLTQYKLHNTLSISVAISLLGYGIIGIISRQAWENYSEIFGMGKPVAYIFIYCFSILNIVLGLIMLIYPIRILAAWLMFWAVSAAPIFALSGKPFPEFIAQAGNFGAPLAFLVFYFKQPTNKGYWFSRVYRDNSTTEYIPPGLFFCLQAIVVLLFIGHGWLNLVGKQELLDQYTSVGFHFPERIAYVVGFYEILAASTVLLCPLKTVLFSLLIWKIASGLFYPHYTFFDWIRQSGSYECILALFFIVVSPLRD